MQIHPMVTVKKASLVLGLEKELIRERLVSGELQGERRMVGTKEKWFIYAGCVEELLEKQRLPQLMNESERISLGGMNQFFEGEAAEVQSEPPLEEAETMEGEASTALAERIADPDQIIRNLSIEFAYKLAQEHQAVLQLMQEIESKDIALKRLTNLEMNTSLDKMSLDNKDCEIKTLQSHVVFLESQIDHLKKPWWKKLFSS